MENKKIEIWKDVVGYESIYQVSNLGNVKALSTIKLNRGIYPFLTKEKILKCKKDKDGYVNVILRINGIEKNKRVHRLVAEAFIPNPENKPCVNHKKGIKTDNRYFELEWVTHQENTIHGINIGLIKINGEFNASSKLTENQVLNIRKNVKYETQEKIAKKYGVSRQLISYIVNRKLWNHI